MVIEHSLLRHAIPFPRPEVGAAHIVSDTPNATMLLFVHGWMGDYQST
jgi:hypothetical protein